MLAGKLKARRANCPAVAGKSTFNRLERSRETPDAYRKIAHDGAAIEKLLVDMFLKYHENAPEEIVLDLDATDDPLHGEQEGRFFHGYYACYCYLPLYVFCGDHLLVAKLRKADVDASAGDQPDEIGRVVRQIRARWPKVRIVLRANSGFAREQLMAWCEANAVDYLFGLAKLKLNQGKCREHRCRHPGSDDRSARSDKGQHCRPEGDRHQHGDRRDRLCHIRFVGELQYRGPGRWLE